MTAGAAETEGEKLLQPPSQDYKATENGRVEEEEELPIEAQIAEASYVKPPNGGYGWVIVAAAFVSNMCIDGVIFTVGSSIIPIWKTAFSASDTEVSLCMSILYGSYLLVGPVVSGLANRYGCRKITILGAIISFFGFLLSIVAPSIYMLYLTFGLIGGVGFGLVYLPGLVMVATYFDTRRALATGIAVCGSGIGTSIFASLNPFVLGLVDGSYQIFLTYIAFVALLCVIPGICYRPLAADAQQMAKVKAMVQDYEEKMISSSKEQHTNGAVAFRTHTASLSVTTNSGMNRPFLSSLELNSNKIKDSKNVRSQSDLLSAIAKDSAKELNRPMSRVDVFYPGSTTNLNMRSRAPTASSIVTVPVEGTTKAYVSTVGLQAIDEPRDWKADLVTSAKSMLDMELFVRPSFWVLAVAGFLTMSCFYVPYTYLSVHVSKLGKEADTKLPITLLGIFNIVARLACGYIADQPRVDAIFVSNVAITAAGLATMAVPLFGAYWFFVAYCVPFAAGVACFAALRTVICVELFTIEKLSSAFGILLMFMGVGAVVGSPLAALIKDLSGNFDLSFYVMGGVMAVSGLMCFPLRKLASLENGKKTNDVEKNGN